MIVRVESDQSSGIASIILNRPDVLNAIDVPLARAFLAAVREVTAMTGLRCIILRGEGRAFMAGGDIASFAADLTKVSQVVNDILDPMHAAIMALRQSPAPVIASVQGAAAGAGFSIVLGADLVVAADNARFLLAYDKLGTIPDCGGTWLLPRKVGRAKALEMMLLSQVLDATMAHDLGLVSEVVPLADMAGRTTALAQRIASGPTTAYAHYKRLVDEGMGTSLADHLERERTAFLRCTATDDFHEGTSAFLAKRPAVFKGQ